MAQQLELSSQNQNSFRFSVIVATRNRAAVITSLLNVLQDQVRISPDVEVIIVDNASADNTRQIVQHFIQWCSMPGRVTYFCESRVGLSAARNAGARLAKGMYTIFLDDDVDLVPHWLDAYRRATEHVSNLQVAGGLIEPRAEADASLEFVEPRYLWIYGNLNLGSGTRPLRSREKLNGGNMLFKTSTFLEHGGLDESFGHKDENLGGAEEQELLVRIRHRYPDSCYYVGEAKVYHRIAAQRATIQYALARVRAASQATARSEIRHRSLAAVGLKAMCRYFTILASRIIPISDLKRAECLGYLEGLRGPKTRREKF